MNIEKQQMIIEIIDNCKNNDISLENNGIDQLIQCFLNNEDKKNFQFNYKAKTTNYLNNEEYICYDFNFDLDDMENLNYYMDDYFYNDELMNGRWKDYYENIEDRKFVEVIGLSIQKK